MAEGSTSCLLQKVKKNRPGSQQCNSNGSTTCMGTLTGSCVVALGESIGAIMTDDEKMASELLAAGERSGDPLWRMPLIKDYKKQLKSQVADINHIGNRAGGAIQCGLFLQEFAGDVPWAHLDIAGPGFPDKPTDLAPNRSTGFGVRLFINWLRAQGG